MFLCVFFFPLTVRRQEARVREGLLSSALWCGNGSEAAQHPPWRLLITADADFLILQCSSVCHCMLVIYVCTILYIFLWNIIMTVISTLQESTIQGVFSPVFFPLELLMQSHLPCSRPRRNKDVSFSCEWAHVTLWICISAQSVLGRACTHSLWISTRKRQRGGGTSLSWCNEPCSSPLLPPLSILPPPLVWTEGLFMEEDDL